MNIVILTGRLSTNPELTYTASGKAVTTFNLAVKKSFAKKEEGGYKTDFFRITTFNRLAETCNNSLIKGRSVNIKGYLSAYVKENEAGRHYYTNVIANNIEFLDSVKIASGQQQIDADDERDDDIDKFMLETASKIDEIQGNYNKEI